ncbi:hypothetical protein SSS_03744 [Sarcoptes scabiei]|uniref:BCL2/adenovirus E1B 19 kDa protein-interacting protein 3-like protein n=1 Tax=Sarcoptes scabiei TaxID=52283 RepID=A0A834VE94_SARSC|nr:hypothetical protein SSS_03744 [Sarcoptes scabiei]
MASTTQSDDIVSLNDSWIDINENFPSSCETPLHILVKNNNIAPLQSLERLLLDAQKESGTPSFKGSWFGSLPITPDGLQTPPNSLYLRNTGDLNDRTKYNNDWIWDWSNRSDPTTKDWTHLKSDKKHRTTFRQWVIRRGILSKEVLSLLLLTNVLSLILGAGIGYTIIIRRPY